MLDVEPAPGLAVPQRLVGPRAEDEERLLGDPARFPLGAVPPHRLPRLGRHDDVRVGLRRVRRRLAACILAAAFRLLSLLFLLFRHAEVRTARVSGSRGSLPLDGGAVRDTGGGGDGAEVLNKIQESFDNPDSFLRRALGSP